MVWYGFYRVKVSCDYIVKFISFGSIAFLDLRYAVFDCENAGKRTTI